MIEAILGVRFFMELLFYMLLFHLNGYSVWRLDPLTVALAKMAKLQVSRIFQI